MKRTFLTAHDIACMPIFFEMTRIHFKEVYDSKTKDQNSPHLMCQDATRASHGNLETDILKLRKGSKSI